jgi:hypothetical protein
MSWKAKVSAPKSLNAIPKIRTGAVTEGPDRPRGGDHAFLGGGAAIGTQLQLENL